MRNFITISKGVKESGYGKIPLSDVMVTRKRNLFMGCQWRTFDVKIAIGILSLHLLALFAPFTFTWGAFWAAFTAFLFCGIFGVTLSYHRNLSHRSLKLPKWLEYTFAYLGRDPIFWVSMHRYHHKYTNFEKDPHSPTFGFWFSHVGWLFDSGKNVSCGLRSFIYAFQYQERKNVEDLRNQAFYRFIRKSYVFHISAFAALVYAIGGFTYPVWVVGVRTTWGYHVTFLVNSACHIWGNQVWNTGDLSKNNWWVAMITFGEGWHNNHHAFEYSARHGLEWWHIDLCWYTIRFLEAVGLATNVKLPTDDHKLKKSFASVNKFE